MSLLPGYDLNSTSCATWVNADWQNEWQGYTSFTLGFYEIFQLQS